MKYKAIITDLDGTLLQQSVANGLPSQAVTKALMKAQDLIHIGIATGRPPTQVAYLSQHMKLSGPSIVLNGALIIDFSSQDVLYSEEIVLHDFHELLRILLSLGVQFTIDEIGQYAITYTPSYQPRKPLVAFVRSLSKKEVEKIKQEISHLPRITAFQVPDWTNKEKWGLHICHISASKQAAVIKTANILGLDPSEIIGIGDSYNDIPLLEACGLKVAMGNAVRDLKSIADYVAPSVDEDGVADVIEKFILEN